MWLERLSSRKELGVTSCTAMKVLPAKQATAAVASVGRPADLDSLAYGHFCGGLFSYCCDRSLPECLQPDLMYLLQRQKHR